MSSQNYPPSDTVLSYTSPYDREIDLRDDRMMVLTPWTVQNICYEVLKNYMTDNPPQAEGYRFTQRYNSDDTQTGIGLEIAYHYSDATIQRRPAIYVSRGEASFRFPTINQQIGSNSIESEKMKYSMVEMPVNLAIIATNVGFAEQLAEYVFKIFLRYQETIRNDFHIRQFSLASVSAPTLHLESKDHFLINVVLRAVFDMGAVIKGDDLKLKTIAYTIFTGCVNAQPFNQ